MTTEHVKIFSGSSIIINGLKKILLDNNIDSLIKNHHESARLGGFGLTAESVELFVLNVDLEKAKGIVEDFKAEINS